MLPKFVDHHPAYNAGGYTVTNEEPEIFNNFLGKDKFQRAACILSGGEVLVSCFLSRAKEIVGIDHSYNAIASCYSKLLLLREIPRKQLQELLDLEEYKELERVLDAKAAQLPKFNHSYQTKLSMLFSYVWNNMRREWCDPNFRANRVTKKRLSEITFVHGDLRDLFGLYGQFDLLYVSNAMEHSGRDRKSPTMADFAKILNPGGVLLYTTMKFPPQEGVLNSHGLDLLKKLRGYRTSWIHVMARKMPVAGQPPQVIT